MSLSYKQKKLKIAVVTGAFPTVSETFVTNHIKELRRTGMKVDFFCLHKNAKVDSYNGFQPVVLTVKGLQPNQLNKRLKCILEVLGTSKFKFLWPTLKSFNVFKYGKEAINAKQFFKAYYLHFFKLHNYDVVHIHFANNAVELLPLLENFEKKIVVTFHGFDAHKYNKAYYKDLQGLTNVTYTVNTNYTRSRVIDLGFVESNISVIPVAVDTEIFTPRDRRKKGAPFTILFVGRLVPFKAPLRAIKIVQKLIELHEDVQLIIIGEGELYNECYSYIQDNGLSDRIKLLGALSQDQVKVHMENSEVFLYPGIVDETGRCENQGLVVQEAQAMGLPVVVSNVGGLPEGLIDGETGFVVEENSLDEFVERLKYLKSDQVTYFKTANKAMKFIKKYYTLKQYIQKLQLIYLNTNQRNS